MGCLICERIGQIERGENPYFVCALSTGYVVLGDHQRFQGYTLFLCKRHVTELYQLPWGFRTRFLQEMSLVAEAVAAVYRPEKMNYELLGNGDTHLHWHLFPRVSGDTPQPGPVWWLPREEMWNDAYRPSREQLAARTKQLREEIERRLCTLPPLMPGEEEQDG
jgi:diadenosine tetraphosphate (Ap4A) HIT family hydrolase